jgi:hypothetical protein
MKPELKPTLLEVFAGSSSVTFHNEENDFCVSEPGRADIATW